MRVIRVNSSEPEPVSIAAAADVLRAGGLVAFPTETVYGLGANAFDPAAVERIYAAKERPSYNPLIAHCRDVDAARGLAAEWPPAAAELGRHFWPGPLTLVVRKSSRVPDRVTAGLTTVALRVPAHPVARALLRAVEFPIAAPSANRFTELSPTTSAHVEKGLADRIDLLLDGGPAALGIESTVVDVAGEPPMLLRPGSISEEEIERVLGTSLAKPAFLGDTAPKASPGMTERHYAPRARVLVSSPGHFPAAAVFQGLRVGALLLTAAPPEGVDHAVRMPESAREYATRLYAALHELDDVGCDVILVEEPPRERPWLAVHDRLGRASHRHPFPSS